MGYQVHSGMFSSFVFRAKVYLAIEVSIKICQDINDTWQASLLIWNRYGAGASVQILLFSVAAIELKRKAPYAHTFLEVARTRYGSAAHITLACYSLFYQVIAAVNLLVGGSTVFSALTGMNRDAACFLFPLGVVFYVRAGGMKAAFLTDWVSQLMSKSNQNPNTTYRYTL